MRKAHSGNNAKTNRLIREKSPFTRDYDMVNGKATAYICQNYACQQPTTQIATMLKNLEGVRKNR